MKVVIEVLVPSPSGPLKLKKAEFPNWEASLKFVNAENVTDDERYLVVKQDNQEDVKLRKGKTY